LNELAIQSFKQAKEYKNNYYQKTINQKADEELRKIGS